MKIFEKILNQILQSFCGSVAIQFCRFVRVKYFNKDSFENNKTEKQFIPKLRVNTFNISRLFKAFERHFQGFFKAFSRLCQGFFKAFSSYQEVKSSFNRNL